MDSDTYRSLSGWFLEGIDSCDCIEVSSIRCWKQATNETQRNPPDENFITWLLVHREWIWRWKAVHLQRLPPVHVLPECRKTEDGEYSKNGSHRVVSLQHFSWELTSTALCRRVLRSRYSKVSRTCSSQLITFEQLLRFCSQMWHWDWWNWWSKSHRRIWCIGSTWRVDFGFWSSQRLNGLHGIRIWQWIQASCKKYSPMDAG